MENNDINEILKKYNFYHKIKLSENISTNGINKPQVNKNLELINKINFKNKKVLDVGCRDGIYSFEAEKLGATEIIAIDNDLSKGATEFLIPFFKSKVQMYQKNLFDLKFSDYGKFDVIIFPGVLYHLRYPMHALKILSDLLNENGILLIETSILLEDKKRAILFCPINDDSPYDPTSCTFFNQKGLTDTLKSFGLIVYDIRLSLKRSFIKNVVKKFLRIFFSGEFFGKKLTSVCRGTFLCEKKFSSISKIDTMYWNSSHNLHSALDNHINTRTKKRP
jgi:SAM-dependent methyltransferase